MIAFIGAAGKVDYSTSLTLRHAGLPVRAILRDVGKGAVLREMGYEIALDVEPNAGVISHGTTELIDALRPLLQK